jgi:hypothetical protein
LLSFPFPSHVPSFRSRRSTISIVGQVTGGRYDEDDDAAEAVVGDVVPMAHYCSQRAQGKSFLISCWLRRDVVLAIAPVLSHSCDLLRDADQVKDGCDGDSDSDNEGRRCSSKISGDDDDDRRAERTSTKTVTGCRMGLRNRVRDTEADRDCCAIHRRRTTATTPFQPSAKST